MSFKFNKGARAVLSKTNIDILHVAYRLSHLMGNARLLTIMAAAAFIFYNLLGTTLDDRQTAVATSPKQKSDMGRILLYITTHMSTTHFWYLDTCWPEALLRSSLLREADVLVYLTSPKSVREKAIQQLNSTFYKNSN